jgi:hypothetical protein
VIFGSNQKLEPPIVLGGGGSIIINASENDDRAEISRITRSSLDSDTKIISSLYMHDVIRETANLGATYPEIISLLEAANRQHNLQGPLLADAKPESSKEYTEAQVTGIKPGATQKKDEAVSRASGKRDQPTEDPEPTRIFKLPKFGIFQRSSSGESSQSSTSGRTESSQKNSSENSRPNFPFLRKNSGSNN